MAYSRMRRRRSGRAAEERERGRGARGVREGRERRDGVVRGERGGVEAAGRGVGGGIGGGGVLGWGGAGTEMREVGEEQEEAVACEHLGVASPPPRSPGPPLRKKRGVRGSQGGVAKAAFVL